MNLTDDQTVLQYACQNDRHDILNSVSSFSKKAQWPIAELLSMPIDGYGGFIWLINIHGWKVRVTCGKGTPRDLRAAFKEAEKLINCGWEE